MTYDKAIQKALTVRWKTQTCLQGESCWCREIVPEQEIKDRDGNEIYIAPMGTMNKEFAEHIVEQHNKGL